MIRSSKGFIICETHITSSIIEQHLHRLKATDVKFKDLEVETLMRTSDAQNVPNSVKLLQAVAAFREYKSTEVDPVYRALAALGELCHAMVTPITDVALSLDEQLTRYSELAHLNFAMYQLAGTSPGPWQLSA